MGETMIKCDAIFGHVRLERRMIPDGDRWACQGRSVHYDKMGWIDRITPWESISYVTFEDSK